MEPPDKKLIRAARGGDAKAADLLVRRYWDEAWRAALAISGRREIANDATQDAFERVLKALGRVDEERPFGAYLHRVVVNRTLDLLKAERRTVWIDDHHDVLLADADLGEEAALLAAVGHLPEDRRVPVVLRYLFGYRPSEIGEILDLPEGTVSSRLARGLAQLRKEMEADSRRL